MSTLLVWREKLQKIYASYSLYIAKFLQLIMGLILFALINGNIGYMEVAASVFCTLGLAVICTFFPYVVMVIAAAVLILIHFYALSLPITMITAVIFLLMYLFYFRFTPKKAWLIILAGLAFALRIPFVIPVVFGLMGTPVWVVPAACGVITYYIVGFVKTSSAVLKNADVDGAAVSLMNFSKQVLTNQEMWLMVMAVVIGILVINMIRTRSMDHSWKIASVAGEVICFVFTVTGNMILNGNISYVSVILSAVLGVLIGLVLEFLFFCVDYSRAENIQFEDDEYYYYVKAVPKVEVSAPKKTVKHITEHQGPEPGMSGSEIYHRRTGRGSAIESDMPDIMKKQNDEEIDRNTDEILLTRSLSKELGLDQDEDKSE